eukprot:Gregarina_sp_Pseudo_9__2410@NODE_2706_length_905_cov_28_481524_g2479_i0_p1_GENE_NODE_2706_length_905_cov_28_481524_g2479_i0NODE_2706_length_905_cov_28_481524_g2479_i0_p1_ORF_typecomplete_len273_score15_36SIMPL/PF04402_14/5_9e27DUF952/PF06108_12/0_4DUF952/PF06108_12/8_9e02_NODE_2706_length_905_cov_28_481524_g2479_i047820
MGLFDLALLSASLLVIARVDSLPIVANDTKSCIHVAKERTISVTGKSQVAGQPDIAVLHCEARSTDADPLRAKQRLDKSVDILLERITGLGVSEDDISHLDLRVEKEYKWKEGEQIFLHYSAAQPFEVTLNITSKASENVLLDEVVNIILSAETSVVRLGHIDLKIRNASPFISQTRSLAVEDAKNSAAEIAAALEMKVGLPLQITLHQRPTHEVVPRAMDAPMLAAKRSGGAAASVSTRAITFESVVDITFELLSK